MTRCVEQLERRTLFAAVVTPTSVLTAYDALVLDNGRFKTDVTAESKAVAKDDRAIAADVKALPKSTANTTLQRKVQAAAAQVVANLSGATSRYEAASNPAYVKLDVAATEFDESLTTGNAKRLSAAQAKVQAVDGKQLAALITAVTSGGGTLGNAYAALASANPTATQLDADLATAENDQSALSTVQNAHVTEAETDISTFLSIN